MIGPSRWVVPLAIGATATAVCLSVLASWQRGGALAERLVWVATGLVLVLSAHLLPALIREARPAVRGVVAALWLACMVTACYGHLTFFLLAQLRAGEQRAASVAAPAPPPERNLTAVMAERVTVTAQLARANARGCQHDCGSLEARRVTLAAKLDALNAEADEVRRHQAIDDRTTAQRDALATDPVTARLAGLFGTTGERIDLLSGLAFASVLEGVACLLWTVGLRSRPPTPDPIPRPVRTNRSRASMPVSHAVVTDGRRPETPPVSSLVGITSADADVMRLAQDVAAGLVRPTVADIRRHLSCSQARATALRRQVAVICPVA
ncbi:hypothetical protein SAMN05216321_113106 [Cupriavidus sp. OV038]|uniref:hypothetical protein n=1 Tax=unclassified Cupriavidus TaxID=2640874 RepID=UPI0008E458DE|nr:MULTISPECIES: hypothetical protein [unclassified Cupriavidus]SFD18999.1 hypothetical protein SAMN05216321_113106 [Cupriavidus sp. OV038]SFP87668.1 hypothetical protein SAMN05216322_11281 [Cupriavidus sp. OV096]